MSAHEDAPGGMPRNFLRPCLLLLLAERPSHGYDLLLDLSGLGLDNVDPGGVYRTLRAMEQDGLVESWWEPSESGPRRRRYVLTDEGRDWLHAWSGSLREVRRLLDHYLDRYERVAESDVNADTDSLAEAEAGTSSSRS